MNFRDAIINTMCSLMCHECPPESTERYHTLGLIRSDLDILFAHKEELDKEFPGLHWDAVIPALLFRSARFSPTDPMPEMSACNAYRKNMACNADPRVIRIILALQGFVKTQECTPEFRVVHDVSLFMLSDTAAITKMESRLVTEYCAHLGISEEEATDRLIAKYRDMLAEAYEKGTVYLTDTFAKYNDMDIRNLEQCLIDAGEELPPKPSDPGKSLSEVLCNE